MNLYNRSLKSIMRKPFKTGILLIIVFVLAIFLAISLIIKDSVNANEKRLINAVGPVGKVTSDLERVRKDAEGKSETEQAELYRKSVVNLTKEQTLTLTTKPYVKMSETLASFLGYLYSDLKQYSSRPDDNVQYGGKGGPIDGESGVGAVMKGYSSEKNTDDLKGKTKMLSGEYFSLDDLKNGTENILISSKYAEKNNLKVGDSFELRVHHQAPREELSKETKTDYVEPEYLGTTKYNLKIIGIYEVLNPPTKAEIDDMNKGGGTRVYSYDMDVNTLKVTSEFLEKISAVDLKYSKDYKAAHPEKTYSLYGTGEIYYESYFFFNSNDDFPTFKKDVADVVGTDSYLIGITNDKQFDKVVAPLKSLGNISTITLISSIVFTILILGLIVMLFTRDRKYEMGIYLSLGEKKINVIKQLFIETLVVAIVAVSLGLVVGNLLAPSVSDKLLASSSSKTTTLDQGFNKNEDVFSYSDYGSSTNISVGEIESSLNVTTVVLFYGVSSVTVLIATLIPGLYVLRLNPKKIMM